MKLTPEKRAALVVALTANCGCKPATLNAMDDDDLQAVAKSLTANAFPKKGKKKDDEEDDADDSEMEPTGNAAKSITERLTPAEQQVWNNAVEITENAKTQIIDRLVANVAKEAKPGVIEMLKAKGLPELRTLLLMQPAPVVNQEQMLTLPPLFMGAAGAPATLPTENAEPNQDDILLIPTLNYAELANLPKKATA